MNMSKEVLREIVNWKLEAKLEDNQRYFYHTSDIDLIESGSRCYVIGRKGTGKTAISEYLYQGKSAQRFSYKLSFKNFPFNDLYELENKSFRAPNTYITLWKYIIYSSVAKMMMQNQNIDPDVRDRLSKVYSDDPEKSLSRTITKWTSRTLQFSVLGTGGGGGATQASAKNETSWLERVEVLEKLIDDHIDDCTYLIIFDELDEDYRDITVAERHDQYTALLTSLFKAVQDVKATFKDSTSNVLPVIFLRDDIYDFIKDPDKNKWRDLTIELDWDPHSIKRLLAFRISRAKSLSGPILSFQSAWDGIFAVAQVGYGARQKKQLEAFDYITRVTQIRPRDYIRYLKACAESALARDLELIVPEVTVKADKAFSNYLRSELEDEIHGVLPNIGQIFDTIAHISKQNFSYEEFRHAYGKTENETLIALKVLFYFSVIGNQPPQRNVQIFRYLSNDARFNSEQVICVHRGLYKALQIY